MLRKTTVPLFNLVEKRSNFSLRLFVRPCSSSRKADKAKKSLRETFHDTRIQSQFQYPHKFECSMTVAEFLSKFSSLDPTDVRTEEIISLSGRVFSTRSAGKSLMFLDLHQDESKVQIKADVRHYGKNPDDFMKDLREIRRGDIIGVTGHPCKTKAGELSILPVRGQLQILSPCLFPLVSGTLNDPDKQYRKRYLDLMTSPISRQILRLRHELIRSLREFLDAKNFVEVETPVLCSNIGGASADPFVTKMTDFDRELFLRISPELYLKMLVIGGLERVYEIGKQFRNEGVDPTHNPEFTSCEFYMAFADYKDLILLTEELLKHLQEKVIKKYGFLQTQGKIFRNLEVAGQNLPQESNIVDFTKTPYAKVEFLDSLASAVGKVFPTPEAIHQEFLDPGQNDIATFLRDLCLQNNIHCENAKTLARLLDKLFGHFVEPHLVNPTFVLHHPICMSPLAKEHRERPGLSERFELFANKLEIVNAYTELNDPIKQREMFDLQRRDGEQESENLENEAYITALEHGLPPTAGWGLGVDRLVMLVTGQTNIRQVIPFPLVRPVTPPQNRGT